MSRGDNIATVLLAWPIGQTHDWDRLGEIYAADVVDHDPVEGQPAGLDGIKWSLRNFTQAFPDLVFEPVAITADDEGYATVVLRLSGTHTGEYLGHAPTGRRFSIRMMQTLRFADGCAVDRWTAIDALGLLRQLHLV